MPTKRALSGMIRRGKYTFEIMWPFPTTLLPASENVAEKNCHGNMPANTSNA
ncbi:hypothetical protein D3C72_2396550 [compost metagenome]